MAAVDPEPMYLRPVEAAALVGLSTRAIYRAVARGELGAVRLCSRLRIPRTALDEWVARSAVRPADRAPVSPPPSLPPSSPPAPAPAGSFRELLTRRSTGPS